MAAAEIGSFPPGVKRFFLLGAPIIALIIYWILPNTYTDIHNQVLPFNPHAKACLAVVVWMVLWWLFEPVPIPVTSLLPIPLFPLLGIAKPAQAMAPYASGTIFLFMGGFILAIAVQRWRLDKRIALTTLKLVGTKAPAIVGGFLLASGVLSMWVSNTATAAMMVPIAMICAIVLFCIPVNRDHMVLDWSDMKELPWGVLLLFGGGLSMAAGLQITECGQIISANAGVLAGLPRWAILIGVSLLVMLASNFTSNTALAATLMPLLASAAVPMGVPAEQLLMVTALSASCAFMMPVGTPPNAIVFSTGRIKIMQMVSAGAVLTLVSVVVIGLFAATFIN